MTILSKIIENDEMKNIIQEFRRLNDRCYLDNAGAALYPESLLKLFQHDLSHNLYMNPHSDKYTYDCIDQIRTTILRHFNTDSTKYSVVFTSGTTQSLKLLVESFQFNLGKEDLNCGSLAYLQENHTSVIGLRELAKAKCADVIPIPHAEFLNALNKNNTVKETNKDKGNSLIAYPAQSNFNGCKYPLNYNNNIKNGCLNNFIRKQYRKSYSNWYILLDAASYVSTNKLDLSENQADFICLSFYKIFGFPTGLGALLIKKESEEVLSDKKYFGGGTVDIVVSDENFHVKRSNISERFEDGTLSFLSILVLQHCFELLNKLIPKIIDNDLMKTIAHHTFYLAKDLYEQLKTLHHPNCKKAVVFYTDSDFKDMAVQGGIVTFNLLRADETYIGYSEFQHMADLFNINIRTGCFCNSGSCQRHLGLTNEEIKEMYKAGHKCGDELDLLFGKPTGCVRVSFGYYNTFADVDKLIQMICKCFVKTNITLPERVITVFNHKENTLNKENRVNVETVGSNKCIVSNGHSKEIYEQPLNSKVVLTEIAIYPIKSCGPFKINSNWRIGNKGFQLDRQWMIVKDNGVCLTQKTNTRMCMIVPKIDILNNIMTLYFKGKQPISIALNTSDILYKNIDICQSKVCMDTVQGYDCGDEVGQWISEALEVSFLRLIRQADNDKRTQKYKKKDEDPKLLSLSNQAQYLLISKATVRWLKDKIQDDSFSESLADLTDRFRGNLIIDTDKELIELEWDKVIIGNQKFKVEGMCSRCQMVCIDQHTGEKTVEPLRTISEQFNGKMRFGIYLSYLGTIDGSNDVILKAHSTLEFINSNNDI